MGGFPKCSAGMTPGTPISMAALLRRAIVRLAMPPSRGKAWHLGVETLECQPFGCYALTGTAGGSILMHDMLTRRLASLRV